MSSQCILICAWLSWTAAALNYWQNSFGRIHLKPLSTMPTSSHLRILTNDNLSQDKDLLSYKIGISIDNINSTVPFTFIDCNLLFLVIANVVNTSTSYFTLDGNIKNLNPTNITISVLAPLAPQDSLVDISTLENEYKLLFEQELSSNLLTSQIRNLSSTLRSKVLENATLQQILIKDMILATQSSSPAVITNTEYDNKYREWTIAFGICCLMLIFLTTCICLIYVQDKALQQHAVDRQVQQQNTLQTDYLHHLLHETTSNNISFAMEQLQCLACGDVKPRYQIVQCGGERPHRYCLECLERYVLICIGQGTTLTLDVLHTKGEIQCPACPYLFSAGRICKSLSPTSVDQYLKIYVQVSEDYQSLQQSLIRKEQQLQDILERDVEKHYHYIIEHILTLHCPNPTCRQVFVDFDNCYALTCSKCKQHFCAWCLQGCDHDAHRHVRRCAFNLHPGREVYADPHLFHVAHRSRRQEALQQYLQENVLAKDREVLMQMLRPQLIELQLEVHLSSSL